MSKEEGGPAASSSSPKPVKTVNAHQAAINQAIAYCEENRWFILAQALEHCWSNKFLDRFRAYFREHAAAFRGMTPNQGKNEHTLEQHQIFTDYLELYESSLSDYIEADPRGPRADIHDFYDELQQAKAAGPEADPGTADFIYCLVASTDYDSFYSVMVREAQKLQHREAVSARMAPPSAAAEAKDGGGGGGGGGAKGSDEDYDQAKDAKASHK